MFIHWRYILSTYIYLPYFILLFPLGAMGLSSVSNNTSEPKDNSGATAAILYVHIGLSSLGLLGNAFVCLVMLRYRNIFNSTTNKLIIHQSIVDFLASLVFLLRHCLFVRPPANLPDNYLGSIYCKLWWSEWPQYSMLLTSTNNLVAISSERYFATCHPVRHLNMFSSRRLRLIIAATWLIGWSLAARLPFALYQLIGTCAVHMPNLAANVVLGAVDVLLTFILPLVLILFAYIKIIMKLCRRSKLGGGNALSKANKNVTKTLLVVAVFFTLCWVPVEIDYFLYNIGIAELHVSETQTAETSYMYQAFSALLVVNLWVNPIIYCFTYERFQKQVRKMVCGEQRVGTTDHGAVDQPKRRNLTAQHSAQCITAVSVIGQPTLGMVERK